MASTAGLVAAALDWTRGRELVRTALSDEIPTFRAHGPFLQTAPDTVDKEEVAAFEAPVLWAFLLRRQHRRAMVLINLDLERSQPVVLQLDGAPAGGQALAPWLTADRVDANNEPDNPRTPEPGVPPHEEQLADFGPGYRLTLPAHSMCVLQWEQEP